MSPGMWEFTDQLEPQIPAWGCTLGGDLVSLFREISANSPHDFCASISKVSLLSCNHCNAKVFGAGMGISMIVAEASLVPRGAR